MRRDCRNNNNERISWLDSHRQWVMASCYYVGRRRTEWGWNRWRCIVLGWNVKLERSKLYKSCKWVPPPQNNNDSGCCLLVGSLICCSSFGCMLVERQLVWEHCRNETTNHNQCLSGTGDSDKTRGKDGDWDCLRRDFYFVHKNIYLWLRIISHWWRKNLLLLFCEDNGKISDWMTFKFGIRNYCNMFIYWD